MTPSDSTGSPIKRYEFPPGLVGTIAEFIYRAAPRPVVEIALAGSLGFMAGICGRAYNVSGTGLNQYILLLAGTGTGKEGIASGIEKLLTALKYAAPASHYFVGPSSIASEQALIKHLSKHSKSFVSLVGEFGLMLKQLSSPNANSTQIGLRRIFLDLYNKSGKSGVLRPLIYSDREKNTEPVVAPAFSLLGESTPESFYSTLDESMIAEGLLPRFTIVEYNGPRPALNETHSECMPNLLLIEPLARLCAQATALVQSDKVIDVRCDEGGGGVLASFNIFCDKQINDSSNDLIRQLWNRAHMKALKLGALVAVGLSSIEPVIDYSIAMWATNFAAADAFNLISRFDNGMVGRDDLETKQLSSVLTAVTDYLTGKFEAVEGYGVPLHIFESRVVPLSFIHRKLAKTAAFRKDRAGATQSIHRAIKSLMDQGTVVELPPQQRRAEFGTNGRMFMLADMWELRGRSK